MPSAGRDRSAADSGLTPPLPPPHKLQQQAALSQTLAALPLIQTGLLLASSSAELSVTVHAPALSTTLCR